MRVILLLFLLLSIDSFHSQNVGFKGKKISAELNFNTNVSISNSRMYNSDKNGDFVDYPQSPEMKKFIKKFKGLKLKLYPELTLNYTVARRVDVGVRIGYDRLNYFPIRGLNIIRSDFYTPSLELHESLEDYAIEINEYALFHSDLEITKVNVFESQLYIRIYGKQQIAPVGYYHQFGLGRSFFSVENKEIKGFVGVIGEESYRVNEDSYDYILPVENKSFYYLSYGLGNKKVYRNGFYFQYGFEMNIYFGSNLSQKKMSKQNDYQIESYNYHYKTARRITRTIAIDHFMQNKFGIGYIF